MIVLHIISKPDTLDFKATYEDLSGIKIIEPGELEKTLRENPGETVMFLGHGDGNGGLYTQDFKEYVISEDIIPLLKNRPVIGLWCYAAEFADRHGLHGFFTSMFISEPREYYIEFPGRSKSEEELREMNLKFSWRINKLIEDGIDLEVWPAELQSYILPGSDEVERFNYETLCYL